MIIRAMEKLRKGDVVYVMLNPENGEYEARLVRPSYDKDDGPARYLSARRRVASLPDAEGGVVHGNGNFWDTAN
jgi:hypothetical protein